MKRKTLRKTLRKTFGKVIDIWDIALFILLGGAIYFILKFSTMEILLERVAWIVFGLAFGTLLIKFIRKIMRKAKR